MGGPRLTQLEDAVERLLQRNAQLRDLCCKLLSEQDGWESERRELLIEVESLLDELHARKGQRI